MMILRNGSFCSVALSAAVARGVACLESGELSPPHRPPNPPIRRWQKRTTALHTAAPVYFFASLPAPPDHAARLGLPPCTGRNRGIASSSAPLLRPHCTKPALQARPPAAGAAGTAWQQQPPRPRRHGPSRTTSSSRAPSR